MKKSARRDANTARRL